MPFEYKIHEERNLCFIRVSGVMSPEAEKQMMMEILADPLFVRDMKILADRRGSSMEHRFGDTKAAVEYIRGLQDAFGRARIAVVTGSDVDYGIQRMFQSLSDGQFEVQHLVFRSLDEAREWLEIDLTEQELL